MQACAAGYALTCVTTPKLQLVRLTVVGLTASYYCSVRVTLRLAV
jgi:hypothetical protein